MNWYDPEGDDLKARDILLKYYSSECTVHGGYILTVAIGVFAFFQLINPIQRSVVYPELFFIIIMLSVFVTVSVYLSMRTIFWGTIASAVTHVREVTVDEAEKGIDKNRDKVTFLLRLHIACVSYFKNSHKHLSYFIGMNRSLSHTLLFYLILFFITALIFHSIVI